MQTNYQVFSIGPFEQDSILKDELIYSDLNKTPNMPFEEIVNDLELTFPQYYDKLDLEHDQRDECFKQFDFLMKTDKEINRITNVDTSYLSSDKLIGDVSNQDSKKCIEFNYQHDKKNQFQLLPEPIVASHDYNQSINELNNVTENSSRKYIRHTIKCMTRVPFVEDINNLNQRRDVINKTCLRTIKRFFKNEVDTTRVKSRYLSSYKKAKSFEVLIQNYAEIFKIKLNEFLLTSLNIKEIHTNYIKQLLGLFINEDLFQRSLKISKIEVDKEIIKFLRLFDECCRQYSHKKFEKLMKTRSFKCLFVFFINSIDDSFLSEITAVKNNLDAYKSAMLQIKTILMQDQYSKL